MSDTETVVTPEVEVVTPVKETEVAEPTVETEVVAEPTPAVA